jgi:hypothetical protein
MNNLCGSLTEDRHVSLIKAKDLLAFFAQNPNRSESKQQLILAIMQGSNFGPTENWSAPQKLVKMAL